MSPRSRRRLIALVPLAALTALAVPALATGADTDNTQAARQAMTAARRATSSC